MSRIPGNFLGIDIGTSSISVIVFSAQERRVLATESAEHNAYITSPRWEEREQDLGIIESCLAAQISRVMSRSGVSVDAIGVSAQMHGVLGLDESGAAITNLVTWQDKSGSLPWGGSTLLEEMRLRAGSEHKIAPGYGLVTLFKWKYLDRIGELKYFCTLGDYIVMKLTGNATPVMDETMADSVGGFSQKTHSWDLQVLENLGLPAEVFPPVASPGALAGRVPAEIPGVPLQPGTAVGVAVGDNQASFVGCVPANSRGLLVNIGTGAQISFFLSLTEAEELEKSVDGFDATVRPYFGSGRILACSTSGGAILAVLHEFFVSCGTELFGLSDTAARLGLWDRMFEGAALAQPAEGLVVAPFLEGLRSQPDLRGGISGVNSQNLRPGILLNAALEALVKTLLEMVPPSVLTKTEKLIGSGNALLRNAVLQEIVAREFGRSLLLSPYAEAAALGSALLVGVATGAYGSLAEAQDAALGIF